MGIPIGRSDPGKVLRSRIVQPASLCYCEHVTLTESKQAALFNPVPPVCPSSQRVIDVPVAVTVPLNGTHELLVVVWAGLRSTAVDQLVEAVGLHLTVQVADAELVLIQPAMA